ncbi:hypothetical protein ACNOYE_02095 [Nannocystaceae bacterium ST9]
MPHVWSIGIYCGRSPLELGPAPGVVNPVLSAADIHDVDACFVADPFIIQREHEWSMFFEILERGSERGVIGLARSADGLRWRYEQVVLREDFHLSYPQVFEHEGRYYMVPETLAPDRVRLYQAEHFPLGWRHVGDLVEGQHADSTLFRHAERWWMFTCSTPWQNDTLRLFGAPELRGPWREHPASPLIVGDPRRARPGGRVIVDDQGRLLRFAQDCRELYGQALSAFEIVELDETRYRERELGPVLGPGVGPGWNSAGMHQLDARRLGPGTWVACVDGQALAPNGP